MLVLKRKVYLVFSLIAEIFQVHSYCRIEYHISRLRVLPFNICVVSFNIRFKGNIETNKCKGKEHNQY